MAPAVVAAGAAILAVDIAETVLIQVVGQLVGSTIGAALAPELLELQQESFKLTNTRALDPALAIDAFIKGHRSQVQAMDDVAASGYDGELFGVMAASAGEPPGLDFLTEAYRRGIIAKSGSGADSTALEQGIRESRLKDKWVPVVEQMQYRLAPPGTAVEAWLRAQLTEPEALKILDQNGVDAATAKIMYKAAGRPPSPQELLELWRRGIIPETGTGGDTISVEQGYLETDLKNKWLPVWKHLRDYIPPPRTITALVREGSMSDAQAVTYYKWAGLSEELAAIYVASAHHQRTAATRELTKAEILRLYVDGVFTSAETTAELEKIGYPGPTAAYEIEAADMQESAKQLTAALGRLRAGYVARKLDSGTVLQEMDKLGIPMAKRDGILATWNVERETNLQTITAAEVTHLAKLGVVSEAYALDWLGAHGFSAWDAWLRLAFGLGGQPNTPAPAQDPLPALG